MPTSSTADPAIPPGALMVDGWMGIDTIRVAARVPFGVALPRHKKQVVDVVDQTTGELIKKQVSLKATGTLASGLTMWLDESYGQSWLAWETSTARLLGHNVQPMSVAATVHHLKKQYDEVADVVELLDSFDEMRVRRCDCVRDFLVESPGDVIAALSEVENHYTAKLKCDKANGSFTALGVGTPGSWNAKGYDKAHDVAVKKAAPDGAQALAEHRLRFELELRYPRLKSLGITSIAALTESNVDHALRTWWARLDWGRPLPSPSDFKRAVAALLDEEGKVGETILAEMTANTLGVEAPPKSLNSRSKYRSIIKKRGLPAKLVLAGPQHSMHLDYRSGRCVLSDRANA